MSDTLVMNRTATPLGLYDADASHVVVGAMGGMAIVDPDITSAEIISVWDAVTSTPAAPDNTVAAAITGTAQEGEVLTCNPGTWTGNPTPVITYQWATVGLEDNEPIAGATAATYTLTEDDVGTELVCIVTGTSIAGTTKSTTAATDTVIGAV